MNNGIRTDVTELVGREIQNLQETVETSKYEMKNKMAEMEHKVTESKRNVIQFNFEGNIKKEHPISFITFLRTKQNNFL